MQQGNGAGPAGGLCLPVTEDRGPEGEAACQPVPMPGQQHGSRSAKAAGGLGCLPGGAKPAVQGSGIPNQVQSLPGQARQLKAQRMGGDTGGRQGHVARSLTPGGDSPRLQAHSHVPGDGQDVCWQAGDTAGLEMSANAGAPSDVVADSDTEASRMPLAAAEAGVFIDAVADSDIEDI